ncbi:PilW family protein [Wohlfahrtiimonas sp. G9077]|uniref:PilW family protein n=1 Tax=Wohlfahrtiimonas sp. G9077 TaxID=1980118 RepID=UPI001F44D7DB|nr:prepilin-type N-terminal cleavage/methylation domain-containing protein [Wohlfahrtiimonas sp. G9077]
MRLIAHLASIMRRDQGFTLTELMVGMSMGLILIVGFVSVWMVLSQSSHQEMRRYERLQDYVEAASYLRQNLGDAIFDPLCPHPEWLDLPTPKVQLHRSMLPLDVGTKKMVSANTQFRDWPLDANIKSLAGFDALELTHLTPLMVEHGVVINDQTLRGTREGVLLATDCRHVVTGRYRREGQGAVYVLPDTMHQIQRTFDAERYIQYYKVNHDLYYVIYENGQYQLVHNFLDGANHMRFYGIEGLVLHALQASQLLEMTLYIQGDLAAEPKDLSIRLLNL